ncbi:ATP-binding protein [Pseudoalteromonas sp. BSi20439]|uniref:ATP-binding protein n=1 Tax=Pseudoalteromonas sp. BSi20439 TaxID=420915 RepID=UPI000231B7AE|nr:MASE1 domain-containing protein [Pseudoalteromonas sp. BSi20439]GAA72645.1 two-component system, NarL family, sensor histidine kinase UhpB [Pseudoalteromonas sp. BSi20439]
MNWPRVIAATPPAAIILRAATKQLTVCITYLIALAVASWVSNHLETVPQSSAIFLPAGIKLAFVIILPTRYWPMIWFASRLYAAYQGSFHTQQWHLNLFHGVWQEAIYFAIIFAFKQSRWPPTIKDSKGVLSLILLASIATASKWFLFASSFEFTTWLKGKQLLQYQLNMTLGDLTGSLFIAPFIILCASSCQRAVNLQGGLKLTLAVIVFTLLVLSMYLLRPDIYPLLRLASLLPIIWFSYHFGITGAIFAAAGANGLIILEASISHDATNTYISQLFILTNAATSLLLGAAAAELRHNNNMLTTTNLELRTLLAKNQQLAIKMVNVQESERKHLSQELHDELGQNLTAFKTDLAVLASMTDQQAADIIAALKQNANGMYDSVYHLMHYLRPRELDEVGLARALSSGQLKSLMYKEKIQYTTHLCLNKDLSEDHQIAIYRICQEAVTNCIKHSSASELVINLNSSSDHITLLIQDNGHAVTKTSHSGGYGLAFIDERAMALGGQCTFSNEQGFTITVTFPILTDEQVR